MNTTTRHAQVETPLGEVTLLADGDALTGLYFRHHWYRPDDRTFGHRTGATAVPMITGRCGQ